MRQVKEARAAAPESIYNTDTGEAECNYTSSVRAGSFFREDFQWQSRSKGGWEFSATIRFKQAAYVPPFLAEVCAASKPGILRMTATAEITYAHPIASHRSVHLFIEELFWGKPCWMHKHDCDFLLCSSKAAVRVPKGI